MPGALSTLERQLEPKSRIARHCFGRCVTQHRSVAVDAQLPGRKQEPAFYSSIHRLADVEWNERRQIGRNVTQRFGALQPQVVGRATANRDSSTTFHALGRACIRRSRARKRCDRRRGRASAHDDETQRAIYGQASHAKSLRIVRRHASCITFPHAPPIFRPQRRSSALRSGRTGTLSTRTTNTARAPTGRSLRPAAAELRRRAAGHADRRSTSGRARALTRSELENRRYRNVLSLVRAPQCGDSEAPIRANAEICLAAPLGFGVTE